MEKVTYCKCGLPLLNGKCRKASWEDHKREPRVKIPKYSGKSKRPYGAYERF